MSKVGGGAPTSKSEPLPQIPEKKSSQDLPVANKTLSISQKSGVAETESKESSIVQASTQADLIRSEKEPGEVPIMDPKK